MSNPVPANALVNANQQAVNRLLNDNNTNPVTNEGNLLSLITLRQILGEEIPAANPFGGGDDHNDIKRIVKGMAIEETRYLMQAMKILTGPLPARREHMNSTIKLRNKYGKDMTAALQLAKVLKAKGDEKEVELMLNPYVMDTLRNQPLANRRRAGFAVHPLGIPNDANATGTVSDGANSFIPMYQRQ